MRDRRLRGFAEIPLVNYYIVFTHSKWGHHARRLSRPTLSKFSSYPLVHAQKAWGRGIRQAVGAFEGTAPAFWRKPLLILNSAKIPQRDKKQELKRIRGDVPQDGRWFRETPGFAYPSATPRREAPSFRRNDCELRLSTRSSFWGQGPKPRYPQGFLRARVDFASRKTYEKV